MHAHTHTHMHMQLHTLIPGMHCQASGKPTEPCQPKQPTHSLTAAFQCEWEKKWSSSFPSASLMVYGPEFGVVWVLLQELSVRESVQPVFLQCLRKSWRGRKVVLRWSVRATQSEVRAVTGWSVRVYEESGSLAGCLLSNPVVQHMVHKSKFINGRLVVRQDKKWKNDTL